MELVDLVEVVGFYSAEPHVRFVVMDSSRPDKASTTLEEALARSQTLDIPMGEPIYQQQFLIQTYGELPNEAQQEQQWETYRKDYARRTMPMCYFARGYFTSRPAEEVIAFCYPVLVPATTALRKFWRAVEEQGY